MSTLISMRLSIAQFINTAILIILVEVRVRDRDLLVDLVKNIVVIFFSNGFIPPLLGILNVWHLIRILKRRKVMDPDRNKLIT